MFVFVCVLFCLCLCAQSSRCFIAACHNYSLERETNVKINSDTCVIVIMMARNQEQDSELPCSKVFHLRWTRASSIVEFVSSIGIQFLCLQWWWGLTVDIACFALQFQTNTINKQNTCDLSLRLRSKPKKIGYENKTHVRTRESTTTFYLPEN